MNLRPICAKLSSSQLLKQASKAEAETQKVLPLSMSFAYSILFQLYIGSPITILICDIPNPMVDAAYPVLTKSDFNTFMSL